MAVDRVREVGLEFRQCYRHTSGRHWLRLRCMPRVVDGVDARMQRFHIVLGPGPVHALPASLVAAKVGDLGEKAVWRRVIFVLAAHDTASLGFLERPPSNPDDKTNENEGTYGLQWLLAS